MSSLKLLSQLRWFRFLPRNLSNFRLFSDVSEPQINIDPKYNNMFNKASSTPSSLKEPELAKFSAIADTWWDSEGPFKPLHKMNPTRLAFIRSTLCRHFGKDPLCARPFEGLRIIDVGCGGGILSEDLDPTTSTIEYDCTTAEKLVDEQRQFDAVIALEVIEHVADPAQFCKSLAALTVQDGASVVSTINRSMRSYATAIVAAEYLLQWLPKGTHQWSSFLTPEELTMILKRASIDVKEMAGFVYNPLTGRWSLSDDISVNFIAFGTKEN
ncbi:ubiquinone biosynthesis O-methyltransferase, mitochondrial isoform X3 [Durio zibethinus]|uniref:Ubiquinone biosynthesis O-methyltransferase, mitochondrial isoform X3 n=1 Tax=Durio zibethinus TaxID=66656 RepID=A0A6P5YKK9_DURZI|nr:ubiquinone biosynthesis O-methyltransferase, mitochondrial isoform X3 [Durio zibethinus]